MYLVPIAVPVHVDGARCCIGTEWKRSLELLRDSLQGRFGPLMVVAPTLPLEAGSEQLLEDCTVGQDGIGLVPSFDARLRLRDYWTTGAHGRWKAQVSELTRQAQVVHATIGDAFRPFCVAAVDVAHRAGKPVVFVVDQDIVLRMERARPQLSWPRQMESRVHAALYERQGRRACAQADLVMLKGRTTAARYGGFSRVWHPIEDTSYLSREIVAADVVQERTGQLLRREGPLRLVFCGRLVDIKGVDLSIDLVAQARKAGADVVFDVIGGGPDMEALRRRAAEQGVADAVHFHGAMPYGPQLLQRLASAHALLFTPRIDETPRMIFDGYAAGLPLVASAIDYVAERAETDQAAVLLPQDLAGSQSTAVATLVGLDRDRERLAALTARALAAAHEHAADRWYERRAQWTFEMVERHAG
ncbi:MAG: glycosyltransferase [Burkholderiaceae bacterium]